MVIPAFPFGRGELAGLGLESLLTELVVAIVMRKQRPFYRSRPGSVLLGSTLTLIAIALVVPYVPFMAVFGFVPVPAGVLVTIATIAVAYVGATELQKRWFYSRSMRHTALVREEPGIGTLRRPDKHLGLDQ